jgi:hypothetical protein
MTSQVNGETSCINKESSHKLAVAHLTAHVRRSLTAAAVYAPDGRSGRCKANVRMGRQPH